MLSLEALLSFQGDPTPNAEKPKGSDSLEVLHWRLQMLLQVLWLHYPCEGHCCLQYREWNGISVCLSCSVSQQTALTYSTFLMASVRMFSCQLASVAQANVCFSLLNWGVMSYSKTVKTRPLQVQWSSPETRNRAQLVIPNLPCKTCNIYTRGFCNL